MLDALDRCLIVLQSMAEGQSDRLTVVLGWSQPSG
jgi:hypothetical protein